MGEDDPIRPIGEPNSGDESRTNGLGAVMIEAVAMEIDRGPGVPPQDSAHPPVAVTRCGQRVLVGNGASAHMFDQANAEIIEATQGVHDVIGRSQKRADRSGIATVEPYAAQWPHVSHGPVLRRRRHAWSSRLKKLLDGQSKKPHPLRWGLVYPRGPDMIIPVMMLGPAWHARPDPGEPGRVYRRSYSDSHIAGGMVA